MKLRKSIKKTFFTSCASLGLFALGTSTVIAQDSQYFSTRFEKNSVVENNFAKSMVQRSSLYSLKEKKDEETSSWEKRIGVTGAFGEGSTSLTVGFSHLYGFGSSGRFKLGYGVRLSSFFGAGKEFSAAPPDLAAEENPQIFVADGQTNAINLGVYTDYSITENLLVGFNIDAVGFSFGGKKEGIVTRLTDIGDSPSLATGSPTNFNVLLVGDNDRGTLNSEFWIGYRVAPNLMVRGAFSYLFTEYTTEEQYQDENDRFRYKAAQGAIGVSYTF